MTTTKQTLTPIITLSKLSLTPWRLDENGANGYVTVMAADGTVVHQNETNLPDEVKCKDAICEEIVNNAAAIAKLPEIRQALFELVNYFEVHTADTGRTIRGEEVFQNAIRALVSHE